jgi:hypothetical protein
VIPHVGSGGTASFCALPGYLTTLKGFHQSSNNHNKQKKKKDWHKIVRIAKRVEQAIMRGKIEGSAMDSRTMMRDESEDNSEGGKCYLYDLAMSHCSISCSNIFSKIDISPPLDFVYQHMSDSRLVASTPLNSIQPLFLGGIIQTRNVNIMVGSWAIRLNSCKIFKNRDRIVVSKKRVEFDDVINHIVTRTSSD